MRKKLKKILLTFLTMLISFSVLQVPTHAAMVTVNINPVSGHPYRGTGTALNSNGTMKERWDTNAEIMSVGGTKVFCIEPWATVSPGASMTEKDLRSALNSDMNLEKDLSLIAYYGYWTTSQTVEDYQTTQIMIWERRGWNFSQTPSYYASKKAVIQEKMANHSKTPSFSGQTLTVNVNETYTLTDNNGVLSKYMNAAGYSSQNHTYSAKGFNFYWSGNKLYMTPTIDASEEVDFNFKNIPSDDEGTNIVYVNPGVQSVSPLKKVKDPSMFYISFNVQKYGKVQITKRDESSGKIVQRAGVEYEIYKKSDNTLISTITSNKKGIAESGLLLFDDYYYIETKAPEKYLVNSTPHYFTISKAFNTDEYTESSISDEPVRAKSTIKKEDKETGDSAQGNATLEGAVYGFYAAEDIEDPANDGTIIYHKDELVSSHTIKNGKATATTDYLGKYYWLEDPENASKGYLPDPNKHEVNLQYQDQNTALIEVDTLSLEPVKKQAFQIEKLESSGTSGELPPLSGAEFTYILKSYVEQYGSFENALNVAYANDGRIKSSEWGRMVTDDNGYAKSKELPFGEYVVKETIVPKDHDRVDDFEINIEEDNRTPQRLRFFEDKTFETKLAVVKQDAETGNTIALSGMRFKVKALTKTADFEAGEYVGYWAWNPLPHYVNEWTTSEDGTVMLEMSLKAGTYQIEEIETPEGYLMNHEPLIFTITAGWHHQVGPDEETLVTTVIFKDHPVKGQVAIDKLAELFKGYQSEMTEYGELFTPVYEQGLLAGAKFNITAKTDIIGMDGTVWYHAGELVETLTSDGENVTKSSLLPLGSEGNNIYSLQEVETAEGYVVDSTVRDFRFDYVDEETEVVTPTWLDENGNEIEIEDTITINNEKQTAIAVSSKVMETSIFDHEDAYQNVMFGVYADEVEGLETDSLVGLSDVDDEGNIAVALSQAGSYYLQEVATDENYVLDETKYPFTYKYQGDKIQTITVNDGVIKNNLKRAVIEVIKYTDDDLYYSKAEQKAIKDMGDMSEYARDDLLGDERNYIAFTEFELATDKDFFNVIASGVTDRDGRLVFEDLELGTYYIREKNSSAFYEINDEINEVTLTKHGQFETVEVKNDLVKSYVDVKKVDYYNQDKTLPFAGFTMYEDEACTKEIETVKTGKDGIAHFDNIRFGSTVYIKETSAPAGYELSDEVVKVTINEDWISGDKETRVIVYPDQPLPSESVNTGSNVTPWTYIGLLGISAAVLLILKQKKKEEME